MKPGYLLPCLALCSNFAFADQNDSCAGLVGSALTECRGNQQALKQKQIEQQLQQQEERQNQLDKQQRDVQALLENMRQQNETMRQQNEDLRKQLERDAATQRARPATAGAPDPGRNQELSRWKAENPWFGSDYARTQLAMRYIRELQTERPELGGRELLDAVSAKVAATFGARQ